KAEHRTLGAPARKRRGQCEWLVVRMAGLVPAGRPAGPVDQVGEQPRHRRALASPGLEREERVEAARAVIGMLVARVGKGDEGWLRLAEKMQELAPEVGAIVRDFAAEGLRVRRLARTGRRGQLGMAAPPVAVEQLLESAVRKAEEL